LRIIAQLTLLIALAGCSALEQTRSPAEDSDLASGTMEPLPERFQLHGVPHNPRKQEGTDCAPDSLRMVLNYRGKDVAKDWDIPQQLTSELTGLRGSSGGTSFHQMQKIAVEIYGLPAFVIPNCDLDSLKAAIVNGWPPVVSYKSRGRSYHAVVAVGYDDKRHNMLIHDPNYLNVRKMRYYDLGGASENSSVQRISCLLILPAGSTKKNLKQGLEKYVPKDMVSRLRIFPMLPSKD